MINDLNKKFAIDGKLTFKEGKGGLIFAEITGKYSSSLISVYGAHILEYNLKEIGPVLWKSQQSYFEKGKPIRGGIPVCWPWFGAHPEDKSKPSHGFARISDEWTVQETNEQDDGAIKIKFLLRSSETTLKYWPFQFELELAATIGRRLTVELITRNTGDKTFKCTEALHSYFPVGNIDKVSVAGLENCDYIDTIDSNRVKNQQGPIIFNAETDRIYIDTIADCSIKDPSLSRIIIIKKDGSNSTVVWNPWIEKSLRMQDFGNEEYRNMLCVETTKAQDDFVYLSPGCEHVLKTIISAENI